MENLFATLSPDIINSIILASGILFTLKIVLIVWILNKSWSLQIGFGNYLKHTRPKSWFRKIWWSACDFDGGCNLCSTIEVVEIYKVKAKYHDTLS
jgi:hypothetical protein